MDDLGDFMQIEIGVLLAALAIVVLYQMLTGRISLRGLLSGDDGKPSAARVQLLVATLVAALAYLAEVASHPSEFPAVPSWLLMGLAGSQIIYLWGKTREKGG